MAITGALAQKPWQPVARISTWLESFWLLTSSFKDCKTPAAPYARQPVMHTCTSMVPSFLRDNILLRSHSSFPMDESFSIMRVLPFAQLARLLQIRPRQTVSFIFFDTPLTRW